MRKWMLFLLAIVVPISPALSQQSIRAEKFFKNVQDRVVIQTSPTQKLVFDEQFGKELVLNGYPLAIYADNVEVVGTVTIRAFADSDVPPPSNGVGQAGPRGADTGGCGHNGCDGGAGSTGGTGPTGAQGKGAGDIILGIKHVTGSGKLIIVTAGQIGGKGGAGGRGGDGGTAGGGEGRGGENLFCGGGHGPGDGGRGGSAGPGGVGGQGGPGGPGASITFTDLATEAIKHELLLFNVAEAKGGPGGPGGPPANPGAGGAYGPGSRCGGGGTNGPGGAGAAGGPEGSTGELGGKGKSICFGPKCESASSMLPSSVKFQ